MRVQLVSESFLPQVNGVTNSVRRVLEYLERAGHEAELLAPTGPDTYAGAKVHRIRGATLPMYADFRIGLETRGTLRHAMQRFDPDVVHIASPAALGYQAVKAAQQLTLPTVAIYQTDLIGFAERYRVPGGSRSAASLTRRIHTAVDHTLAPSRASVNQLARLGIDNVSLWPRGVDLETFNPGHRDEGLRRMWGAEAKVVVGYVGRLAREKELHLLAPIAKDPRYSLVIVGGGPEEHRLRALMPQAIFTGTLHGDALSRAYASLDIFCHTGRYETYCQSAQEALASGVPVVAPAQGGPVDVVDAGSAGFLYLPGSAPDLARFVDILACDRQRRAQMGEAARSSVIDRGWPAVNAALIDHYRAVRLPLGASLVGAVAPPH